MASISTQHSYIVLRDQEDSFRRGTLVKLESNGKHYFHSLFSVGVNVKSQPPPFQNPGSTPVEWGVGLKVGDTVLGKLPDKRGHGSSGGDQYTTAIIRWIGMASWEGHRFGVEITVSSLLYHHIMTSHHNHHFCTITP